MTDFCKSATSASLGFWPRTEFRFESHTGLRLHIWLTKSTFISSFAVSSSSFQDFSTLVRLDRVELGVLVGQNPTLFFDTA